MKSVFASKGNLVKSVVGMLAFSNTDSVFLIAGGNDFSKLTVSFFLENRRLYVSVTEPALFFVQWKFQLKQ